MISSVCILYRLLDRIRSLERDGCLVDIITEIVWNTLRYRRALNPLQSPRSNCAMTDVAKQIMPSRFVYIDGLGISSDNLIEPSFTGRIAQHTPIQERSCSICTLTD